MRATIVAEIGSNWEGSISKAQKIIEECNYCLIFWDGISKGTKSSIDFCKKFSIEHKIIYFS